MRASHGNPQRNAGQLTTAHSQPDDRRRWRSLALFAAWVLIATAQPLEAEAQRGETEPEAGTEQEKSREKGKKPRPKEVKSDRFVPFEKIKADSAIAFPVDI